MASESPWIGDGCQTTAAADLSTKQFYAVKITAARAVNLASSGTEAIYGILQNKPKSGDVANIAIFGICKAIAGAAITAGDGLATDTSGRVITYASGVKIGVALETVAVAGQLVTIKVVPVAG